jgi:putative ABC transport system ATP-binding protein
VGVHDGSHRLSFEDVVVRGANGERVLAGLSVEMAVEGITVVAGPSGSGKTTMLRLVNRLEVPTSGRVLLDGVDLATLDPLRLRHRVGMVFQRPVMFAGTVRDNLCVAEEVDDDRLGPGLVAVGLSDDFLVRQADDLSGGEAQRVCIARALTTRPEMLLMDEPTSALDLDSRRTIEGLARRLADDGLGIIWVTHDLEQVRRIADRTLVLSEGHLADASDAARFMNPAGTTEEE